MTLSTLGTLKATAEDGAYGLARAILPSGHAGKIRSAAIEVTRICNLRCPMCWLWSPTIGVVPLEIARKDPLITKELTMDEIHDILDALAPFRTYVHFSGGEPFMRKGLIEAMEYASSLGLRCGTVTNGTKITDEMIARLVEIPNLNSIAFSIDGTEEVHDSIRGKGNYRRTVQTAQKLLAARKAKGHPWVTTNSTLTPAIKGNLLALLTELRDLGFDDAKVQHLWYTTQAGAEAQADRMMRDFAVVDRGADSHVMPVPGAEYGIDIERELELARLRLDPFPVISRPNLSVEEAARYYGEADYAVTPECRRPWTEIIVRSNGDVVFCPDQWAAGFPAGNIRAEPLLQIWRGENARLFREKLDQGGLMPACAKCCGLNLTYTGGRKDGRP